jgi:transposase
MASERVSIAEAAARLQVSEQAVRCWIEQGKLAAEPGMSARGQEHWLSAETVQAAERVLRIVQIERLAEAQAPLQAAKAHPAS